MAVQYAFAKIVTDGLALAVDAADPNSYPGTGTTWRDITPNNNSGTITGSIAYSTAYKGGFVFSGPTASITFSTASANFGTGSFTVEMAFQPDRIQGIHYLVSKNSGSFPNWSIYLSGSNNAGKLYSEFKISSAVSTSISSSTTFVTGSVYQVDVRILPSISASGFYIDGAIIGGATGSAAGSLTNTGSLFLGNSAPSSSQAFSGSIFNTKIYLNPTVEQPVRNFNAVAPRFSKPLITDTAKKQYEILVVAGGGGSGLTYGGGGGAGGLQYINTTTITPGSLRIVVGSGGGDSTNGQNSSFDIFTSIGGGRGGTRSNRTGSNGGSGGGGQGDEGSGPGGFGTGSAGQGNNGATSPGGSLGGGGGGAGAAAVGGNGGSGSYIASFAAIGGSPAGWFAGGGGGGQNVANGGTGGIGGGGAGNIGNTAGFTGSANTGGGGGGGTFSSVGVAGGSGIVAIRYNGLPVAIGGEITQSAGYTYHVFRNPGASSLIIF
jgi:hypothetical protein